MRRSEDENQTLSPDRSFPWPIDMTRYDRTLELSLAEREALKLFVKPPRDRGRERLPTGPPRSSD